MVPAGRKEEGEAAGTLSRTGGLWEEGEGRYIVIRETNGRLAETGGPGSITTTCSG